MNPGEPLLEVTNLTVDSGSAQLVRGIGFTVARGERVGVIGESGSGKSLTALACLGLLDDGLRPGGSVRLAGVEFDLLGASDRQLSAIRGKRIGMVFQEPMTALNPVRKVGSQITEGMRLHGTRPTRRAADEAAVELLDRLRLPAPRQAARSFPHQLSGGQRPRGVPRAWRPPGVLPQQVGHGGTDRGVGVVQQRDQEVMAGDERRAAGSRVLVRTPGLTHVVGQRRELAEQFHDRGPQGQTGGGREFEEEGQGRRARRVHGAALVVDRGVQLVQAFLPLGVGPGPRQRAKDRGDVGGGAVRVREVRPGNGVEAVERHRTGYH